MTEKNTWPSDTDGEILQLLEGRGFDFDAQHEIEFMLDFKDWPLGNEQQKAVLQKLPAASFVEADEAFLEEGDPAGYVSLKITNKVTYDFVTQECKRLSNLFADMGGYCDSWCVTSGCGG